MSGNALEPPAGGGSGSTDPEVVRDTIAAALVAGSGIAITPNDGADTITIAATGGGSTDPEVVRDTIASALVAGANVTITPNDPGDTITIATTGRFSASFSVAGDVATGAGSHRWYAEEALTIVSVRASVGTAPTGAALIVDVNKNGTTVFTTQANRPQIAAGTNTDLADAIDVTSLALGDFLTVDVDQIGSGTAGANLTVTIVLQRS